MTTHDGLDGLGGLVGVVEWDGADVMVEDVGFDDTMEEAAADESEFAIDGCGGATREVPCRTAVVRKRGIGVLEVGDGHCFSSVLLHAMKERTSTMHSPSQ